MKILALDLSTKSTGFCFGSDENIEKSGYLTASLKDPRGRIVVMREAISKLIRQNNIDKIIMEEVRPDYNSHTGKVLMWLQAAIVIAAYQIDPKIECDFIGASSWRAVLGIKQGRGVKRENLKAQDIKYVKDKYNVSVQNDDEADAICIYDAYFKKEDNEINWE